MIESRDILSHIVKEDTNMEIAGKINTAICYAKVIEDEAIDQIRRMCDYPFTEGSKIRIMPDVHAARKARSVCIPVLAPLPV